MTDLAYGVDLLRKAYLVVGDGRSLLFFVLV